MSTPESASESERIANPIVELLDGLLRQPGPGQAVPIDLLLRELANWPADGFSARPSEADFGEVHSLARAAISDGRIPEAVAWCAANLVAAGAFDSWQWAEWIQGLLLNDILPRLDEAGVDWLLWLVERCDRRFRFERDPHSQLGLLTLLAGLHDVKANLATMAGREALLRQAVTLWERALPLAQSLGAAPEQIAAIRLSLGRDLTALFRLGANAETDMMVGALVHLDACRRHCIDTGSPLRFEVEHRLAEASECSVDSLKTVLDEPAMAELEPERCREMDALLSRNLRHAIAYRHRAIRLLPPSIPRAAEIAVDLHRELIGRLIQQAGRAPRHAARLLGEADRLSSACLFLAGGLGEAKPLVGARQILARLREAQYDLASGTTREATIKAFQQALDWARVGGSPWERWDAARGLAGFLLRSAGADPVSDARSAFGLIREAADRLLEMAGDEQLDERFLRLVRGATRGFWGPFLDAAARAGKLAELSRVFEAPAVLSGMRPSRRFDELPDRSALSCALPGDDWAVVYMHQGSTSFRAFVVHRGPLDKNDLIVDEGAPWERLRALVDPWIRANQRLREPVASSDDLARLHEALRTLLASAGPMLMDRLALRLLELGIRRVVVVRGRGLGILPLHALSVTRQDPDATEPASPQPFLERFVVTYAASGLDAAMPAFPPESGHLLAVGDPRGDLPWAAPEVHLAADAFGPSRSTKLLGKKARLDMVLPRVAQADVVHFATHGEYEIELKGLVTRGRGALQLADGELLDLESLDALELARRPIVMLSACETGRTDWRDLVGLGIADRFLARGASAVVATLWVVDDVSTALLMWKLYGFAREGQDLATALQSAQLWLRDLTSDALRALLDRPVLRQAMERSGSDIAQRLAVARPFAEPFYWAPFYLSARGMGT